MQTRRLVACYGIAAVFLGGCFTYRPLQVEPQAGLQVRAVVTDEASVQLGGALGRGVEAVEGRVLESGEENVTLAIRSVRMRRGDDQFWRGERYALPRGAIATLEERRLDYVRTGLAAGSMVALWAVLFSAARGSSGSTGPLLPHPPGK